MKLFIEQITQKQIDAFWSKTEPSESGCIEWIGYRTSKGYGQTNHKGRPYRAHRFSFLITHGSIDEGLPIDHLCRNRACVNPQHLELVTHKINRQRSVPFITIHSRPGTGPSGERNRNAKISSETVLAIRSDYLAGVGGYKTIGRKYGISKSQIQNIVKGSNWKHIPNVNNSTEGGF